MKHWQRLSLLFFFLITPQLVFADCGVSSFQPDRTFYDEFGGGPYWLAVDPANHSTLYLTDPANQQYAAFDLEWGGSLASLRYKAAGGVYTPGQPPAADAEELIWGNDPGGMMQLANWAGNTHYNPEQAGDLGSNGSPLYAWHARTFPMERSSF